MPLGQAINYIDPSYSNFIILCEQTSILGTKLGNFIVCKRYGDERLKGDILNTEVYSFSSLNDMVAIKI